MGGGVMEYCRDCAAGRNKPGVCVEVVTVHQMALRDGLTQQGA